MSYVPGLGYNYYDRFPPGSRSRRSRRKSRSVSKHLGSAARDDLLTVAAYLYKKTGRSWFVGPRGVYLAIPAGVRHEPAARQIIADVPEAFGLVTFTPATNQLFIPKHAAIRLAHRLSMKRETVRDYCRKIGAPHEQRFFRKPIACDPWLAAHMAHGRFGGLAPYHF